MVQMVICLTDNWLYMVYGKMFFGWAGNFFDDETCFFE